MKYHGELAKLPAHLLHVSNVDTFGHKGQWTVWLNTEVSTFDGLCIGIGDTRQEAVQQATTTLERALTILQENPSIDGINSIRGDYDEV